MAITVNVNGVPIQYPQTGDPNWADDATNFAIQTSAALSKIGLSSGTSVDITQTLDVTGNTTLDANLSVGGNASVTGNTTLTGNLTVNGNTQLGNSNTDTIGVTGIVNVDSGVLYVDPVNNRVGINDTTPSEALDITGNVAITGNETVGGTLGITGDVSVNTNKFNITASSGNTSIAGTLGVTGDVAINTNKFNVTASSGNTTIAGTLGVTGDTSLTGTLLNSNGSPSSPSVSFSADSDNGFYYIGSNNFGISVGGSKIGEFNSNGFQGLDNYALFNEEQNSGTSGGTFTSGAWRTRPINTDKINRITGMSRSTNTIIFPAGTYKVMARAVAYRVGRHAIRLYNVSDSSVLISGTSAYALVSDGQDASFLIGEFTIAATKNIELQHQCQSTFASSGLGLSIGTSFTVDKEIYSQLAIWRIA